MSDSVFFSGRQFISASNAASLAGYTSDYIGQLARSGKISSRLVGRARFVDKEELHAYVSQNKAHKKKNLIDERDSLQYQETQKSSSTGVATKEIETNKRSGKPLDLTRTVPRLVGDLHDGAYAQRIWITPAVLMFVMLMLVGIYVSVNTNIISIFEEDRGSALVATASAGIASYFEQAADLAQGIFSRFVFTYSRKTTDTDALKNLDEYAQTALKEKKEGLVVIPPTGDVESDRDVVKTVSEVFSDEVRVVPSSDGFSGVITPVFRESLGQPFLYVLVPVNEEDFSSQP